MFPNSNVAQLPAKSTEAQTTQSAQTLAKIAIDEKSENLNSFIAAGDVVNGNLEVQGGARVAGTISGNLVCKNGSAVIEMGAKVLGSVEASMRVIVAGGEIGEKSKKAEVSVVCPNEVVVCGPGVVNGGIFYGQLATYDGGLFRGSVSPYADRNAS